MAECKTKGSEEQNFTDFTIQLAPFLHVFYCFVFPLATFFILCVIGLSLFFNAFPHPAYLPSLCVSLITECITFFILCAIGLSLFFNAFRHPAYLPSLCVSLLLSVSLFLNLHHISSYSFLGIKKL